MWQEFNIKPFPAETIVFRDGVYIAELSTIEYTPINKKYELPIHIIYVGDIDGKNNLNIELNVDNQPVYLSVNIKNKKSAFLNIFAKNAGKNSEIRAHVMLENNGDLIYNCTANHIAPNTTIIFENKLIANKNTKSKLSGTANIENNCEECSSDINFSALADKDAKVTFMPSQKILSIPNRADHGASIYKPNEAQILYLRESGLSGAEVNIAMREAFINSFTEFC